MPPPNRPTRPTDDPPARAATRPETDDCTPNTVRVAVDACTPAPVPPEPRAADSARPAHPEPAPPGLRVGDRVLGFRLIEQLGEGAFAQVFLAEQEAIAGRHVVLKVTPHRTPEPERLGRLQHPNVVPIHSVHSAPPHELICMPFLGRTTLARLIATARRNRRSQCDTRLAPSGSRPPAGGADRAADGAPPAGDEAAARPGADVGDVRWVLRTLADLAAGLDHAHRRGILHLDIKPENVLMADAGEPMLFDFNLAHDTTRRFRDAVGGTLPYMAPEQIEELISREHGKVDVRTDLFALGAVAYELLTCEPAFPTNWMSRSEFPRYLEVRRGAAPSPRAKNPAVSPAADALVRKLLAPAPADRYQTAQELRTDLDRHLADLPLASAPDRSIPERLGKWRRRNPWLPLYLAASVILGLVLGLGVSIRARDATARTAAAVARAEALRTRLPALRMDLTVPGDAAVRARGRAAAEQQLAPFGLPADPQWRQRPAFAGTPEPLREAVAADLGEVLVLLAHARRLDRLSAPEPARAGLLEEARALNGLARDCFAAADAPPFLHAQRAELAALAGEPDDGPPPGEAKHPRDHYLEAVGLIGERKFRAAVGPLERALAGEPGHAAAQFALGACRHQLRQYTRALERYDTAQAMLPGDPRPAFNRGLVFGAQGKVGPAEAEFTLALAIDPGHGESYLKRAGVRRQLKKYRAAEEDLTRALECGVSPLQVYSLRAQVRALAGDTAGAESDRRAARGCTPATEADFVYRGRSRLPGDPKGALADFEAAAALNPYALAAVQSQAHVWSEYLRDDARALAVLAPAAEFAPEDASVRAGRAILLARTGNRDDARREAEAALALSDDPTIVYETAGVFARSAAADPADADRALALLRQAVRDGFRDAATLDADPDLDPIRRRPEFANISRFLKDSNR